MSKTLHLSIASSIALLLIGCGGGGSTPNTQSVVDDILNQCQKY